MIKLTKDNFEYMLKGAGFYSTGGGIPYHIQMTQFETLFSITDSIDIYSIEELLGNEMYICNVYGIGSAGATNIDLKEQFKIGFEYIKQNYSYDIGAIFEAETNIESAVFTIAYELGFPVIDADCTGGRAVPELIYDNFVLKGVGFTPVFVIDAKLNVSVFESVFDVKKLESQIRDIAVKSGGSVAVIDHILKLDYAKDLLTLGVLERNIKMGNLLSEFSNISDIVSFDGGLSVICEGQIVDVDLIDKGGFLSGKYVIKSKKGELFYVFVKNENMYCLDVKFNEIVKFPDFIILFSNDTNSYIHNSSIKKGENVTLFKKDCSIMRSNYEYKQ